MHAHIPQCYQYTGILVTLKAAVTQHATSNPKQTWELGDEGGAVAGKMIDYISVKKRKVGATRCLSHWRVIEGQKREVTKTSRQGHKAALTDQHWLKDMWKGSSQNTALPSWTFYSAENCSRFKRRQKKHASQCASSESLGLKRMAVLDSVAQYSQPQFYASIKRFCL